MSRKSKVKRTEDGLMWEGGECTPNPCEFQIVLIGDEYQDPSGLLKPGMEVMLPCDNCGQPASEQMAWLDSIIVELEKGFKAHLADKNIPLFHWSPSRHRNQITRYGLLPNRRPTTHSSWRAPYICFADDPAWAWALSGGVSHSPAGEWDLWQTYWDHLTEPEVLARDDSNGIHEVRTAHRVYKRGLSYLGSRTKS